ncbi:hypothetical protein [Rurimicrobium arvi]|uniref:FCD domain-containing protein n=1 Tax=Rurimicrobium arvi TaxID=2049916 RepID=A0ABP8MY24_9BACT
MKNFLQFGFIELSFLVRKFADQLEDNMTQALFREYKKLLEEVHFRFPENENIVNKIHELQQMKNNATLADPFYLRTALTQHLDEVINEIGMIAVESYY